MADAIPTHVWFTIAAAAAGCVPAAYLFRYWRASPSRRDITLPPQDLNWRTTGRLYASLASLALLGAIAFVATTSTVAEVFEGPFVGPTIMMLMGGVGVWTVIRASQTGVIEPLLRGFTFSFERSLQPRRFWASMAWNGAGGAVLFVSGAILLRDIPADRLRERCTDIPTRETAADAMASCDRFLRDYKPTGSDYGAILNARGTAHYVAGRYNRALADYDHALKLDPKASWTWYNRGLVDERLGDYSRAIVDYSRAIDIDPDNADALMNRGVLNLNAGRLDDAVADFNRRLKIDPDHIVAHANRGMALVWKREFTAARRDLDFVRARDPRNVVMLHADAMMALHDGDRRAAIRSLSAAIAIDPQDKFALESRAHLYKVLGEEAKAAEDLARLTAVERAEQVRRYPMD